MELFLGSDHAGFLLKEALKKHLELPETRSFLATKVAALGQLQIVDLGVFSGDVKSDYPEIAWQLAQRVADEGVHQKNGLGILVCGSGLGVCIAANKIPGIRAAHVESYDTAVLAKLHNDANILCLGGRITIPEAAIRMVDAWLTTPFEGGRHQNRIDQIKTLETSSKS